MGTPMILNIRQAPPPPPPHTHEKVNACQLCPSRLCLQSEVAEFGITRLQKHGSYTQN